MALRHQFLEHFAEVLGHLLEGQLDRLIFTHLQGIHEILDRLYRKKQLTQTEYNVGGSRNNASPSLVLDPIPPTKIVFTMSVSHSVE